MIQLQASNSNGVYISQIQFAGQTVVSNIWMDEDKDPKYLYCPCDRYDRQCTDSQVVLYYTHKKLRHLNILISTLFSIFVQFNSPIRQNK